MKTPVEGQAAIICEEALVLVPYDDNGSPAIGAGHRDKNLKPDTVITPEEAIALAKKDIEGFEKQLDKFLTREVKPHEYAALVSLLFNLGYKKFKKRVNLISAVNENRREDVVQDLVSMRMNQKRRLHEALIYYSGEYRNIDSCWLYRSNPRIPNPKRERYSLEGKL